MRAALTLAVVGSVPTSYGYEAVESRTLSPVRLKGETT